MSPGPRCRLVARAQSQRAGAGAGPLGSPAKPPLVVRAGDGELEVPKTPEQRARADSFGIDISLTHYYAPDRTDSMHAGLDKLERIPSAFNAANGHSAGQPPPPQTNGSSGHGYQRML
mmetsp:Transcript_14678/g.38151  ORF Transcript_14678/g.38151 Transcript_14678/m.38151 type:complete len:118 (-) Transcript_14678:289-642(-)